MKLVTSPGFRARFRRAAFTIVEMWMSMAVGSMCMGACSVVYVMMAKEHRAGLADSIVEERIDNLQDRLSSFFRTKSATAGVTLGGAEATNSAIYRIALVTDNATSPAERVYFDAATGSVMYDPNAAVANNETVLWGGETNKFLLENMYFTPGLKEGYRPNGSVLNICLILKDDKAARRRSGTGYLDSKSQRTFTVRLRGP